MEIRHALLLLQKQNVLLFVGSQKTGQPYIGFAEGKHLDHKNLLQEKRSRMKIMPLDADKDLPVKTIESLLKKALDLYRSGKIKV